MPKEPADTGETRPSPAPQEPQRAPPPSVPPVPPPAALIGTSLGSFRLVKLIGEGGMGAVFLAQHPSIGSKVAIKLLHSRFATSPEVVERFFNEARAVNRIGHENIVKIIDLSVTETGDHYLVMEYLDGQPLSARLSAGQPMPFALAGPILLQCCAALQAAHERGIVHRDLKPDNIFLVRHLGRPDFVRLLDFGIAKLTDDTGQPGRMTAPGTVIGTPSYMSPEQADGETDSIDARSDIYSLGVVMFQMVCGKKPFGGPGMQVGRVLAAHRNTLPPRPRELCPAVPERLEAIILRALAKERGDRQPSMKALGEELAACLLELGLPLQREAEAVEPAREQQRESAAPAPRPELEVPAAPVTPSAVEGTRLGEAPAPPRRRRRRWLWAALLLVVAPLALAGTVVALRPELLDRVLEEEGPVSIAPWPLPAPPLPAAAQVQPLPLPGPPQADAGAPAAAPPADLPLVAAAADAGAPAAAAPDPDAGAVTVAAAAAAAGVALEAAADAGAAALPVAAAPVVQGPPPEPAAADAGPPAAAALTAEASTADAGLAAAAAAEVPAPTTGVLDGGAPGTAPPEARAAGEPAPGPAAPAPAVHEPAAAAAPPREAPAPEPAVDGGAPAAAAPLSPAASKGAEQAPAKKAAKKSAPKAAVRHAKAAAKVKLRLQADRPTSFKASWPGGFAHGQTPQELAVPADAQVRLIFTRPGAKPQVVELVANKDRAVQATLSAR
jgi:serine/threonine-protein kinase